MPKKDGLYFVARSRPLGDLFINVAYLSSTLIIALFGRIPSKPNENDSSPRKAKVAETPLSCRKPLEKSTRLQRLIERLLIIVVYLRWRWNMTWRMLLYELGIAAERSWR